MFVQKKKYYLFIENTREFSLKFIKKRNKFIIIYRNQNIKEKIDALINFRRNCKKNGVDFYIANNTYLLSKIKADGLYISLDRGLALFATSPASLRRGWFFQI